MADQKLPATFEELVAQRQAQLRDGTSNFEQLQTERKQHQNDLALFEPVVARLLTERDAARLLADDLKQFHDMTRTQIVADLDDASEKRLESDLKSIDGAITKAEEQAQAQQANLDAKAASTTQKEHTVSAGVVTFDKARAALKNLPDALKAAAAAAKRHQATISAALAAGQARKAYVLNLLMAADLQKLQELIKPEAEQNLVAAYQKATVDLLSARNELRDAQTARDTAAQTLKTAQDEQKKLINARGANIQALYSPQPLPNQ